MANSKEKLIAKKYAEALSQIKISAEILKDLELIKTCFESSSELLSVLVSPAIKSEIKKNIIKDAFGSKLQNESLKTLLLLLDKRRIKLAPSLLEFYKDFYYKSENIELAEVESAKELSKSEIEEIKTLLEKSLDKNIKISESRNEKLIAGMRIKVANKIIDSSLKSKLKQMKNLLLK